MLFVSFLFPSLLVSGLITTESAAYDTCSSRVIDGDPKRSVCVCDLSSCDQLNFEWPKSSGETAVVESSIKGARFQVSRFTGPLGPAKERKRRIVVRLNSTRQEILGWGGAVTDSAAINILSLPAKLADQLVESYYGPHGLQYNFARVPIGGTDLSTRGYSYDDSSEPDYSLSKWALSTYDTEFKIPVIKKAMKAARMSGVDVKLIGAPWSPPVWMKTNKKFARGFLKDKPEVYRSYAEYLMKFFDAYEERGIKFWGASVQNEPGSAYLPTYTTNGLQYKRKTMAKFITQYLGPALKAHGKTKDNFKLIAGDDSLYFIDFFLPRLLEDADVQKYVSGIGFHWYTSGTLIPYEDISRILARVKGKIEFALMTEACEGSSDTERGVELGQWERAESYAKDIIKDLHNGLNGWIDWNLALDTEGGPSWTGNFLDSPIIVNSSAKAFYKQPMYYALGHFSRFFRPGSTRLETGIIKADHLETVAVLSADKQHVILNVLNSSKRRYKVALDLDVSGESTRSIGAIQIEARSIVSIITKL